MSLSRNEQTLISHDDHVPVPRLAAVETGPSPDSWRDVELPTTPYTSWGKRLFDLVGASALLVALSPILLGVSAILRIKLGPKIMIRQKRTGLHGQDFEMFKFRTMLWSRRKQLHPFDGTDRRQTHKSDEDPRHTDIGRFLRKTSIDELPQLLNVLRGEMALVGPRPELAQVVDMHDLRDHPRHAVRPGVTGLWQVSTRQDGALLHESVEIDHDYLSEVTFKRDVSLMWRTIAVVLGAGGR